MTRCPRPNDRRNVAYEIEPDIAERRGRPASHTRPDRPAGRKYNLKASAFQANPSKTKQKSLDLLGFIRPNRGFSRVYSESK
jgi:hypothetical protein